MVHFNEAHMQKNKLVRNSFAQHAHVILREPDRLTKRHQRRVDIERTEQIRFDFISLEFSTNGQTHSETNEKKTTQGRIKITNQNLHL